MPCRDGSEAYEHRAIDEFGSTSAKLDHVTDLLCKMCRLHDKRNQEGSWDDYMPTDVRKWFIAHKKDDEIRNKAIKEKIAKLDAEKAKLLKELED